MAEVEAYPEDPSPAYPEDPSPAYPEDPSPVMETSGPEETNNNNLEEEVAKPVEIEPREVMDQVIQDVEVTGRTSLHAVEQGFPYADGIQIPDETPDRLQLVLDLLGAAGEKVAGDKVVNGKFVLIRSSTSYIYLAV